MKVCEKIDCKKEHENLGRFCSRKCANSRTWSEEDKLKKSNSAKNSEKVKEKSKFRKGKPGRYHGRICERETRVCLNENCNNTFETKKYNTRKFCSLVCGQTSTYYSELKSEQTKEAYARGKKVYGGTTKWYNVETSNGTIRVQGTYEVRTCKILDNMKRVTTIKNWEYTKDRIEYRKNDGQKHLYLLDFKVWNNDNSFYYVETKGYKTENDELKWNAVKDKGIKLEVWYKQELNEKERIVLSEFEPQTTPQ